MSGRCFNTGSARFKHTPIPQSPWDRPCLDIHTSKESLGRALTIANAVIFALDDNGFEVTETSGKHRTSAQIFGYRVPFSIIERYRQTSRREVR